MKHFEGDLTEDKETESNILAEGPERVARNLLGLKDGDHREDPTSPDLTLALGTLVFDQTSLSETE